MKNYIEKNIPLGSVVGLNYSGMHDSSIAVVSPVGTPIFSVSLERYTRVKQDGRPPYALIENIPWDRISAVAVSTDAAFKWPVNPESTLLETTLPDIRPDGLRHQQGFYDFLDRLPCEKRFICHQTAHAASAFWGSGFDEALCLTYDGGMANSPWFGGLFSANRYDGVKALDRFSALHYAKVTSLYTFVTALLGFNPNKHEGKITGLAAYGRPTGGCRSLLKKWFELNYYDIESVLEWTFAYSDAQPPSLAVIEPRLEVFRSEASRYSREELSATVQEFAENHILAILARARKKDWSSKNICLAGGLFANVKINQRIAESGFKNLFVAPPMTDDGTAIGAAWHALSHDPVFDPPPLDTMYMGPSYSDSEVTTAINSKKILARKTKKPAKKIAKLLAEGNTVAIFDGPMEFGPRALGNRSILAPATRNDINQSLNERLCRTEFMPFAPITRAENSDQCYLNISRVERAARFMTVTVDCTKFMKEKCPAVVHVDGTARPQLIDHEGNGFIHSVLTHYYDLTGIPTLVNTSFNIHEQPIVCSPEDAIQGFFESGLDYLLIGEGHLISFEENARFALQHLLLQRRKPSAHVERLSALAKHRSDTLFDMQKQLEAKEAALQQFLGDGNAKLLIDRTTEQMSSELQELKRRLAYTRNELIGYQRRYWEKANELASYRKLVSSRLEMSNIKDRNTILQRFILDSVFNIYRFKVLAQKKASMVRNRIVSIIRPRLGNLNQYAPRPISDRGRAKPAELTNYPSVSIVTPSYQQGNFIEKTILSVLNQKYPQLEFFVQDGASTDQTVKILRRYEGLLSGWQSKADSGQSQAINRGFAKTNGEIMAWLNSDDLLLPNALATVASYFDRHPDVDVVYGNRLLIDDKGWEIGRWMLPRHDNAILSWVDYVPQETLFWRREIWDKAGGSVDESFGFAMDWDLLIRFREAGAKFAHLPVFLGAFRVHELQKTSSNISDLGYKEMNLIRERALGWKPDQAAVRRAIMPFLLKHLAVDMQYRMKQRLQGSN